MMTRINTARIFFTILFGWAPLASCYSYANESLVRADMFKDYSDSIRPVLDQGDSIDVHLTLELLNVENLDVKTQTLSTTIWVIVDMKSQKLSSTVWVTMKWIDEKMQWNTSTYDGVLKFFVHDGDTQDVWKPDISVSNTIDSFEKLGDGDVPIVVNHNGIVIMESGKVVNSHCEVDMTYYPFDSQKCEIIIGAWVYSTHEVNMTTEGVLLENYRPNGEWQITSTNSERHDMTFDGVPQSVLWFTFNFSRRRPFFTMHIILPMLFLSVLNIIVFVLPPDAGEKMSLAITNLLSFAVFLTLFSDHMPHSSQHTPVISVYLASTFIISVFTVVVSTIVLKLHFREGPVPSRVKQLYCGFLARAFCHRVRTCRVCFPDKDKANGPSKLGESPAEPSMAWSGKPEVGVSSAKAKTHSQKQEHDIDWKMIARITDWMAFVVFLFTTVLVGGVVVLLLTVVSTL